MVRKHLRLGMGFITKAKGHHVSKIDFETIYISGETLTVPIGFTKHFASIQNSLAIA